jgi:hypothetical protein
MARCDTVLQLQPNFSSSEAVPGENGGEQIDPPDPGEDAQARRVEDARSVRGTDHSSQLRPRRRRRDPILAQTRDDLVCRSAEQFGHPGVGDHTLRIRGDRAAHILP